MARSRCSMSKRTSGMGLAPAHQVDGLTVAPQVTLKVRAAHRAEVHDGAGFGVIAGAEDDRLCTSQYRQGKEPSAVALARHVVALDHRLQAGARLQSAVHDLARTAGLRHIHPLPTGPLS